MATPYMSLTLPTVSVTAGPTWASQLNAAYEAIDSHDHSSGKGVPINPTGLDISSDLDIQGNDLTTVRSVRFDSQSSALAGASDLRCMYFVGNDAWINDGSGTAVQMTSGGQPAGSGGSEGSNIVHAQTSVVGNVTILASDTFVTLKVNTAASRQITLPAASSVDPGRYYIIKDVNGLSETNAITLARAGSDTIDGVSGNATLSLDNGVWSVESDGVSNWLLDRAAPDFLTKTGLVLGTSATVTVGSGVTISSSALVAGNSSLDTSKLIVGSNPSQTGGVRLGNNVGVYGRNAANSADIEVGTVTSGNVVRLGTGASSVQLADTKTLTFGTARTPSLVVSANSQVLYTAWTTSDFRAINTSTASAEHIQALTNMPDGATLSSYTTTYAVTAPAGSPTTRLRTAVFRIPISNPDAAYEYLLSTGSGYTQLSYSVTGAWTTQTITLDQNNTIDNSAYNYYVVYQNQDGAGAARYIGSTKLTFSVSTMPVI